MLNKMLFRLLAMSAFYRLYKKYQMRTRISVTNVQYINYPPEVRRGGYWGLGVFLLQYSPLVKI